MFPIMEVKRPFSDKDWLDTPEPVKAYIIHLEQLIGQMLKKQDELEKRIEKLEAQSKMKSQNSSKPPSSDVSYQAAAIELHTDIEAMHEAVELNQITQ